MKVRVAYTVEVNDDFRRAIRIYYGQPGLASRAEVARWFAEYGDSGTPDLIQDLWAARARGEEPMPRDPAPVDEGGFDAT